MIKVVADFFLLILTRTLQLTSNCLIGKLKEDYNSNASIDWDG